jgi:hypothetical protein
MLENWQAAPGGFEKTLVSPHSARLSADENREQRAPGHRFLRRDSGFGEQAMVELLSEPVELVLLNRAGDEVREERREV